MKRLFLLAVSMVTAVVTCGLIAGARPATGATPAVADHLAAPSAAGGSWAAAQQVPGLAALNAGGAAEVSSVSCASAGNCAAGGYYRDSSYSPHAFVVDESGGSWGTAQQVAGAAGLNAGGYAEILSVSCPRAGNCAAGGWYADPSGHQQAFVVDETGGSWGTAQEVPGSAALNTGGYAEVSSVSCSSAGNCAAGGIYMDSSGRTPAFVVDETGGSWGTLQQVPGSATLSLGNAEISSVSCASAGNCAAGGTYTDSSGHHQAFVVDETGGSWDTAQEVPGSGTLNAGGYAAIDSVSCPSAGNCAAGGFYEDSFSSPGQIQAFVVDETGGSWGTAQEVPGSATLNSGAYAVVNSASCASAGNCTAGGFVYSSQAQAFVANEDGGSWGTAQEVPDPAAFGEGNPGLNNAGVNSVSCASVGNCAAGGYYPDSSGRQALVADEAGGSWSPGQEVPGSAALNTGGYAEVSSVSCAQTGYCAAGGYYQDSSDHTQAFVVNEKQASSTSISLSAPTVSYGHEQAERLSATVTSQHATPGGAVTVTSGTATVCTIKLSSGSGSCTLPETRLPAGTAHLTASYPGSAIFAASRSPAATLSVARATSKSTLSLSAARVTYGHEQAEHLTVTIIAQYSGTPGGKVTIKTGTVTVCVITLASGRGSCTLTARQLPAGTRTLVAAYHGSSDFTSSASARRTLTVAR